MLDFAFPSLSPASLELVCRAYGLVLTAFLLWTAPLSRWFFLSERWGGYASSTPEAEILHNPWARPLLLGAWFTCSWGLLCGRQTVLCAAINLALCWYFFVFMRWRGILRGGGAPGFMNFWVAACVFFLSLGRYCDPSGRLLPIALLAFQVDFAIIMLCAGTYKALSGYRQNHGMQLGLVNPWWGYWSCFYKQLPYHHPIFRFYNFMAWTTEVVSAVLMLIPGCRFWGALIILLSFLFIATQIRLGVLCETVMVGSLIFFGPGTPGARLTESLLPWLGEPAPQVVGSLSPLAVSGLVTLFWFYMGLLPLAKLGLYYNLFAKRRLWGPLQLILERWTNFFGIIIWRVFTSDVVNFFVRVWVRQPDGSEREYTSFGRFGSESHLRYTHVCEFVCFASLFTTLKYYPNQPALFRTRLARYARSVPCSPGELLRFEYLSIVPGERSFEFVHAADFIIDPHTGDLQERVLDSTRDVRGTHEGSPVKEGVRPGSYAPRS